MVNLHMAFLRRPYFVILVIAAVAYFCLAMTQVYYMYANFCRVTQAYAANKQQSPHDFSHYLSYRFSYWFSWRENSQHILVVTIFALLVMFGTIGYAWFEDKDTGFSFFKVFVWLVNPDGGTREATRGGRFVGFVMSLGGLLIFAFVISMVHEGFDSYLQQFRDGVDPVIESDHIVILGWSDATLLLIEELCMTHASTGGVTIVVLSNEPKVDVESKIKDRNIALAGCSVVVRSGIANDLQHLWSVSVGTCSQVILMPDPKRSLESRDATAFQVLYLLKGQGWPLRGRILVVCSLVQNERLLEEAGGSCTSVVLLGSVVAKLMSLCSRGWGVGMAVNELMGYCGNTFHVKPVPNILVGKTFLAATRFFPSAVLVGLVDGNGDHSRRRGSTVTVSEDFRTAGAQLKRGQLGEVLEVTSGGSLRVAFKDLSEIQTVPEEACVNLLINSSREDGNPKSIVDHRSSLMPKPDRVLKPGEQLILMAEDEESTTPQDKPVVDLASDDQSPRLPDAASPASPHSSSRKMGSMMSEESGVASAHISPEFVAKQARAHNVVLFLGFNEWIGLILLELDRVMAKDSRIVVFAPESHSYREEELEKKQRDRGQSFSNVQVIHVEGQLASYFELEDLLSNPLEGVTEREQALAMEVGRVFVMLPDMPTPEAADALAVATTLQVRDILYAHGCREVPIVPQISNPRTNIILEGARIWDYVSTSQLEAKVIAMYNLKPLVGQLMAQITSSEDPHVRICKLERAENHVSFFEASRSVARRGMVLLGWTLPNSKQRWVTLNPDQKHERRRWRSGKDRLMVLASEASMEEADSPGTLRHDHRNRTLTLEHQSSPTDAADPHFGLDLPRQLQSSPEDAEDSQGLSSVGGDVIVQESMRA